MDKKKRFLVILAAGLIFFIAGNLFAATKALTINTYYPIPYGRYGSVYVKEFAEGRDVSDGADKINSGAPVSWRVNGLNADLLDGFSAEEIVLKKNYIDTGWFGLNECCYTQAYASVFDEDYTGPLDPSGEFYLNCPSGYYVSSILHWQAEVSVVAVDPFIVQCCKLPTLNKSWDAAQLDLADLLCITDIDDTH